MINRVLIRIKVVQMLYSHLLIENHFMLESQPASPTKEKRFAYSLYLDTLVFMVRLSEKIEKRGGHHPLAETRYIKRLRDDDKIKSLMMRYGMEPYDMEPALRQIADTLKESSIYKNYLKRAGEETAPDARLWRDIFEKIIMTDTGFNDVIKARENYTMRGVERFRQMMENTFVNFMKSQDNLVEARRELNRSLDKARELYMRLLYLPVALVDLRERQIDDARHKYIKSDEDLYPNLRFVDNELVGKLRGNDTINNYLSRYKIDLMMEDHRLLESLMRQIMQSDIYADYMNFPVTDFQRDVEFWREIFRKVIFTNTDFLETMETMSVFWNDDLDVVGDFVLKTLRRFLDPSVADPVLPQYKDEEDARFGSELFTYVIRNKDEYRAMTEEAVNTESWDTERLAFMDVVIIMTALAEILNFPRIPLTVSLNEYIEIAKCYSTGKSGMFVNGVLGNITNRLLEEGKLRK